MPDIIPNNNPLSYLGVKSETPPNFIKVQRSPNPTDFPYELGTIWLNTESLDIFVLVRVQAKTATWLEYGTSIGGVVTTLTGDSGGAISPVGGNINIEGRDLYTVDGSGNTLTITETPGAYPVTPFVVGLSTEAGYQTVQAALDAADSAGGGTVVIQPGTYTENLTLRSNVALKGLANYEDASSTPGAVIVGFHTAPSTGFILIENLVLRNTLDIISSIAAGSTEITLKDIKIEFTTNLTAFVLNLNLWTGPLRLYNVKETLSGTKDGIIQNSMGSSPITISSCQLGTGPDPGSGLQIGTGNLTIEYSTIGAVVLAQGSGEVNWRYSTFLQTIFLRDSVFGDIFFCNWKALQVPAISMDTSNPITLSKCIIDTSANPSITGAGAGVLALEDVSFLTNSAIAGTVGLFNSGLNSCGVQKVDQLEVTEVPTGAIPGPTMGIATLVGGSVTVPSTSVLANSRIFLAHDTIIGTPGHLSVIGRNIVTDFTIASSSGTDTSIVIWILIQVG